CAVLVATHDPELIALADDRCELPAPDPAGPPPAPRRRIPADALNPLTLCLIGILAAIGSFAVQTWQVGLLALLPTVRLAPRAERPPRRPRRAAGPRPRRTAARPAAPDPGRRAEPAHAVPDRHPRRDRLLRRADLAGRAARPAAHRAAGTAGRADPARRGAAP